MATIEEVKAHLRSGIKEVIGLEQDTEEIFFICKDGYTVRMYHCQDCCEYVRMYEDDCVTNKTDIFTDCKWCEIEETIKEDYDSLYVKVKLGLFIILKLTKAMIICVGLAKVTAIIVKG